MASSEQKIEAAPCFGRFQRLVAYVGFGLFQITLYVMMFLMMYAICTCNFSMIAFLAAVSFFQSFASRSQGYIRFVNNIIQPRRYLEQFQVFYEEQVPDETQQSSLFGLHPHGVFSLGLSANMNFEMGPLSRMVGLASRAMLCVPFVGLLLRWYGTESVHGENMKKIMKQGKNIGLLPGGFEEATMTTPKQLRVYIKERKGFIKYAMEHNYTIYPVLILNQHQAFWTFDHLLGFRLWLNKLKLPSVMFFNRKSLMICPFDIRMYTVVGRAVRFRYYGPHEVPTQAQIDEVHGKYISEIERVYAKYAKLNNNVPMVIY